MGPGGPRAFRETEVSDWLARLAQLTERGEPHVLVTVASVRGHAPRGAGAKMVVTRDGSEGSVGGGDLEASALARARTLLEENAAAPELLTRTLNPRGGEHGVQCCGGEVTLLLEPFAAARPTVAVFGAGHVARALLHQLAPLPVTVRLVDGRTDELARARLPEGATARLEARHAPAPEAEVAALPRGAAVLVMTHDHAEDLNVIDQALRRWAQRDDLAYLGLIGSRVKWSNFRARLLEAGHEEEALERVTTPIGVPGVPGKTPAAIAIAVAAQLLTVLELPESD